MQYRICKKSTIRIVGVKIPLVEEHEVNMLLIPRFWQQTIGTGQIQQISKMAELEPYGVLGISVYFDPQHIYYYIAAATNRPVPPGMEEFRIPEATWCMVTADPCCHVTSDDMFRYLHLEVLPSSGLFYAELPDIEVYPIEGRDMEMPIQEAWFAVRPSDEEKPQKVS